MIFLIWLVMFLVFMAAFILVNYYQGDDTDWLILGGIVVVSSIPGLNLMFLLAVLCEWASDSKVLEQVAIHGRKKK